MDEASITQRCFHCTAMVRLLIYHSLLVDPTCTVQTGVPLIYELDKKTLKPIKHPESIDPLSARYLGDVADLRARIEKVKNQTAAGAH